MTKNNDLKYLVALAHFSKFGPIRLKKIRNKFSLWEDAFRAGARELAAAGIEEGVAEEFAAAKRKIDPDGIMEKLEKEEIGIIAAEDENYPELLKEIYAPPAVIYCKGNLPAAGEFNLAVVGSRKYSPYGSMAVERVVGDLAAVGLNIVSGLALGIDSLAHNTALAANGKTIAVLGSGPDKQSIYPHSNRYLADKITASGGAVISEFPPGTPPLKHHFPQRNRIIAGLSFGVLVVEAGAKSGTLITARFALEQNREVFAIPGGIFSPNSEGTNELIKRGAKAVTAAADIMEALDLTRARSCAETEKIIPQTPEEKELLSCLGREPTHINEIIRASKLDTNIINSTLTIMEMKGMVRNLGNMRYVLAR